MDEPNVPLMNFSYSSFVRELMSLTRFCHFVLIISALLVSSCEDPQLRLNPSAFDPTKVNDSTPVREVLLGLGKEPNHLPPAAPTEEQIEAGKALTAKGQAELLGGKKLSAYFYCLDCHGSSPDQRLPASPFAGLVNREIFFNGAAADRYGASSKAQTNLEEAIQFCSVEIARGRELENAEMDAVLAYLWSLELKISNLAYSGADLAELKRRSINPDERTAIAAELRDRFPVASTVTKGELPADPAEGYVIESAADPERGARIWSGTCLHCHGAEGASEHFFGDKVSTWKSLSEKFAIEGEDSLYHRLRNGTFDQETTAAHMPMFPIERLSDAEIEDLRAYIESHINSGIEF